MSEVKIITVVNKYDEFRKELNGYFRVLPIDLNQTLDEIREYLIRNRRDDDR